MKFFLLLSSVVISFLNANAQAGSLDASFGNNGHVFTDFGANVNLSQNECRKILALKDGSFYLVVNVYQQVYVTHRMQDGSLDLKYGHDGYSSFLGISPGTAALQSDGKVILTGTSPMAGPADFILARLKTDGSLDSSFSGDGFVTTNFPGNYGDGYDQSWTIAIQNDGKIIASGSSNNHFAIARYLPGGALDTTFSTDGLFTTDMLGPSSSVSACALQVDGKLIAVGNCRINGVAMIAIARLTQDGTPDNTFSSDGFETICPGFESGASAVEVQTDSKILIGGNFRAGSNYQFGIARLLSNGDLDNSFSSDGIQTIYFGQRSGSMSDMALQPDGKIVVAGMVLQATGYTDFGIARINSDGSLDNTFSGDGVDINALGLFSDNLYSMALRTDGKILVAGSSYISQNYQFAVIRYNSDGILDNSFDGDGILFGFKPSFSTSFNSSAVQQDGKIVVVGYAWAKAWWTENYEAEMAVVRYNLDGTLDNTFSDDGKLIIDYGTGAGNATSVAIQKDGKIVIGGTVSIGSYNDFAVVRLNADGSFDNSFSGDGKLLTDFGNTEDQCLSIAIQKDGKIVAAGYTIEYGQHRLEDIAIARYNIDGSLDNTFSGDGKVVSDFISRGSSTTNTANKVFVQDDGKIVVTGQYALWDVDIGYMAARYLSNGTLDLSFNGKGFVTTDIKGQFYQAYTSVVQPNGKIVIAGIGPFASGDFATIRYNTNGSLDSSFSSDGILEEGIDVPSATAIQADGKLIFAGFSNNHNFLSRYNPDGTPDNTFGDSGKVIGNLIGWVRGLSISANRIYTNGTIENEGTIGFVAAYQVGCSLDAAISDAFALPIGVERNTVYIGYAPASSIVLRAFTPRERKQYSYLWSIGATTSSIRVSPTVSTTYTVTISNQQGCSGSASKFITVKDIRCGNKMDKVLLCQDSKWNSRNARTICTNPYLVPALLCTGSYLGMCKENVTTGAAPISGVVEENVVDEELTVYPNPSNEEFTIIATSNSRDETLLNVYDASGRLIEVKKTITNKPVVIGSAYKPGIYYIESVIGNTRARKKLIKQ